MSRGAEWNDRIDHWILALEKDLYTEIDEIAFEGFTTYEHIAPEIAKKQKFKPYPAGTTWGEEWQYLWIKGTIRLPKTAEGKMIVLNLNPGGEAAIFVNGEAFGTYRNSWEVKPHQLYQDNILTESGKPGETFDILCEVFAGHFFAQSDRGGVATGPVIPGDYNDPLEGKTRTKLGRCTYGVWNEDAYTLWMDVRTLREIKECLSDGSLRAAKIEKALRQFTLSVDFEQPPEARIAEYKATRKALREVLDAVNGSTSPTFYAVGNAHLDVVWLWPYSETIRKTARTFAAQLRLLEKYHDYKFIQSQPQTYVMCKEHYPKLYEKVKAAIKKGNWIIEGGMWVEPDTNMSSGESLIRQLIYGKRFIKEEFDIDSEILWLPDTFGYSAALPQILNGCGINYLVTQKIFWSYNKGEQFPYHYFNWQGSDGSKIKSFLPTNYTYDTNPKTFIELWENRVQKDDMDKFLFPFGYGDGGGGPCRDHIEFAMRQKNLEGSPKVEMAHPLKLFRDLDADGGPEHTYVGELYFNAHRGVYTTQAAIKKGNRKSEIALREAEMWSVFATRSGFEYPVEELEAVWKKTLVNQFHDILPGSSIKRASIEAVQVYDEILESADKIIQDATAYLVGDIKAGNADTSNAETLIFNSLSWERTAVITPPERNVPTLVKLPPCGYTSISSAQVEIKDDDAIRVTITGETAVLENGIIRAELNRNGEVISFKLKETDREYASGVMNRFALFKDVPRLFDAWDIDSMYELEPVKLDPTAEIELIYSTDIKAAVSIKKKIGNSTICQKVSLEADSRRLEFDTTVEWNELHRLLKVKFPMNIKANEAINEIQYGYIKRPTHRSRAYDKDRFEVCNHRYTALCDENNGVAVLNDCKYGVSTLGNEISLTLLRAAASPEMRTDNGTQRFTYAITAWEGCFYTSPVVREGYELNTPPLVISGASDTTAKNNTLPENQSYFRLEDDGNIILDTVKSAEDGSGDIIIRLYESKHATCKSTLHSSLEIKNAMLTDMLENDIKPLEVSKSTSKQKSIKLHFNPFEVKTIRLTCGD